MQHVQPPDQLAVLKYNKQASNSAYAFVIKTSKQAGELEGVSDMVVTVRLVAWGGIWGVHI
jgi:hypothetical protein